MSDIVERLKSWCNGEFGRSMPLILVDVTAEITRLRAELAEARDRAIDEAAEVADHHREKWGNAGGFESQAVGARIITQAIRALKSPKPPIL